MSLTAFLLILLAAFMHATWNLLAKRAGGGAAFVWAAAVAGSAIFLPISIALGLFQQVTWNTQTILFVLGSGTLQIFYFLTLQKGYAKGDLSLVYPLARGTGPLFATIGAVILLGEQPTIIGLIGAAMIILGVFAISSTAPRTGGDHRWAIGFGLLTGIFIASYTLWDKVAVSALLIPPILLDSISATMRATALTPIGIRRWPEVRRLWRDHKWAIVGVGFLSELSYILVLTALKTAPVILVAPMREISILIGTVMGAKLLAEGHLQRRLIASSAILLGVVVLVLS